MFDTLLPWLGKICVALVIAFLLPKLFARSRGGAEPPHAQRSVRSLGGGGSVLDDGWANRKKNQTAGQSQQEQPQGPSNRREAAAAAAASRRSEGSVNQTCSNGEEDDVTNITDEEQWKAVLTSSKARPVVVKMTASWCSPCKRIDPSYVLLARKHTKDMSFFGSTWMSWKTYPRLWR